MGKYGTFTFTPPHEMTNWDGGPFIHVSNYGAYGSYNEQWRRIESNVRSNKFISIAQLLYILHRVVLPFDDDRYTKGWRSIDDFEERENPFAKHTCPVMLYVKPPVDLTEEECKKSLELGQRLKEHNDWIREWQRVSTWIVVYNCLKEDPIEWADVKFEFKNTRKMDALEEAAELVRKQYGYCAKCVNCYEAEG